MKLEINGNLVDRPSVWWEEGSVFMIDQTKLPFEIVIFQSKSFKDTALAIKQMIVRGAPAIGAAGAYGTVQAIFSAWNGETVDNDLIDNAKRILLSSRPTAVDLRNGVEIVLKTNPLTPDGALSTAKSFVQKIIDEGKKIGENGKHLIRNEMKVLTHCHTGAPALVDYGSALACIIAANNEGKKFHVYVDETRPRIQGRLTTWELSLNKIPHTVICDSAAASLFQNGDIDIIIVGADRVAVNGDIANKIGTYNLAVLAKEHSVPFYTAFPSSTYDPNTLSGKEIEVEIRSELEVERVLGLDSNGEQCEVFLYPKGTNFLNPAFDVTPARYISGYVTPVGILSASELVSLSSE